MQYVVFPDTFPVTNEELENSPLFAHGDVAFVSGYAERITQEAYRLVVPKDWPVFINPPSLPNGFIENVEKVRGILLQSRKEFIDLTSRLENGNATEDDNRLLQRTKLTDIWQNRVAIGTGCLPVLQQRGKNTEPVFVLIRRGANAPVRPNQLHEATGLASGHPLLCGLKEGLEEIALTDPTTNSWIVADPQEKTIDTKSLFRKIYRENEERVRGRLAQKTGKAMPPSPLHIAYTSAVIGPLPKDRDNTVVISYLGRPDETVPAFPYLDSPIRTFSLTMPLTMVFDCVSRIVSVDGEAAFPGDDQKGRGTYHGTLQDMEDPRHNLLAQTAAYFAALRR
ncbi:MAG: hypothetical protein KBC88_00590 [Alphaproteobacteria bacterium]|nr:hypothetical protein [Alphaproteobacteria bacterium]MBP9867412.1 hypothetical protein [Alphaproteobacteria bacterium]